MLSPPSIVAVLCINAIFGGAYVVGKVGVDHFPPFLFAGMRFVLVAFALSPFLRWGFAVRRHWKPVLGFCLTMGVGVYATMYWALSLADGASSILIGTQFSAPAAVLMGAWFLHEKAPRRVWYGILLAMAGVCIVGFDTVVLGYPKAFALVLLSACCYAIANVISRRMRDSGMGLLNLNAMMALVSAPPMFMLSWLSGESWEPMFTAELPEWLTVFYSALVVSMIGHVGLFRLLQHYPLSAIMPFYVFTPIFGVLGAILFLGEEPTMRFAAGAALAIAGVVVVNTTRRDAAAAQ